MIKAESESLICYICSPDHTNYFIFKENYGLKFIINSNVCFAKFETEKLILKINEFIIYYA